MFAAGGSAGYREVSRFAYEMPAECLEHASYDFIASTGFGRFDLESQEDDNATGFGSQLAPLGRKRINPALGGRQPQRRSAGFAGIKTADSLLAEQPVRKALGPIATPEQLVPGTLVAHPTFGRGIVQITEPDPQGDPMRLKITVKFDALEEPKKLIFKFAKLELFAA